MKKQINKEMQSALAVVYARYSSHSQRDCPIEQQVAECEEYARSCGLRQGVC